MIHRPDFKFREALLTRKETKYIVVHHVGVRGSFSAEDIHQMLDGILLVEEIKEGGDER